MTGKSTLPFYFLLVSFLLSWLPSGAQEILPHKIVIHDVSIGPYVGKYEFKYELTLVGNHYELVESDLTEDAQGKKLNRSKLLLTVPLQQVVELVEAISHQKDSLTIQDLGYEYDWFEDHIDEVTVFAREIWETEKPNVHEWNTHQIRYIKEQLKDSSNLARAVSERFDFFSSSPGWEKNPFNDLTIELHDASNVTTIEMGRNYRGLPWRIDEEALSYNQGISEAVFRILPQNEGENWRRVKAYDHRLILKVLISSILIKQCEAAVQEMVFFSYADEIDDLQDDYDVSGFREESSGSFNWDGENRICMEAKDPDEVRNIQLRVCLTREGSSLYSRDSIVKKGRYYLEMVNQIPFLLDYLDEDERRRIEVIFDNDNSVSEKLKRNLAGGGIYTPPPICLEGVSDNYLNQCVYFILYNEKGHGSNWIITPESEVILDYFQNRTVYRYTKEELGFETYGIYHACRQFDLEGNLK